MRNPFRAPVLEGPIAHHSNESPANDPDKVNLDDVVKAGEPPVVKSKHPVDNHESDGAETFTADAQAGVQQVEAITTVWTKNSLIAAYLLMWLITFVDAMHQGSGFLMTPYVTSAFGQHSLTAYTGVMSGIMGGVLKLPLAKVLDIFGRPQGFLLCTIFLILGLILMAACDGVQTYAAAQIFYLVGYNGLAYTISIFIADTSHLKHRGFMYAYVSSPYIVTVWMVGPLADVYLDGPGWRWFYGSFALITLIPCVPLLALFWWNYRKAVKAGLIKRVPSGRTFSQNVQYYFHEFDVGGLFLLTGGLVFFLLPFNLYSYQEGGWKSPLVISFLIIGGLMLISFALYEKFLAKKTFIPYQLLLDRTVFGACMMAAVFFVSFYLWNGYFSSFLQVVNHMNVTQTGYITNIYSIGACFWSFVVGALIIVTGKFKWIAVYMGVPLTILGVGLMIHFRQANQDVGYVIMCQIFIAFAGGAIVITEQIAVMAATSHQYVAVVLAIEGMFTSVGGAIGGTVASAIWTGIFPAKLAQFLPAENQGDLMTIYGDLSAQLSYPVGSPARIGIELAYAEAQKYMCIAATSVLLLALVGAIMWRDINIKCFKQVKGRVA